MKPVILAVAPEPQLRGSLAEVLERRFSGDYSVAAITEPADALEVLAGYRDEGRPVALVLAPLEMGSHRGVQFLVDARRMHPSCRRVVIIDVGDVSAAGELNQALTLNHIDLYFGQPWASPEEELYPVVGEALRVWSLEHQPRFEKAVIVDEDKGARGRYLRSWLERNGVVTGLHSSDSPRGRTLLAEHALDAGRLPVAVLWDGRLLVDPADDEIAEALGGPTHPARDRYDVAIVGGGPAGLATATYTASEGLSTVVIEREAWGGQAGTSSKIRNFFGFPWGVSGAELADRSQRQAAQLGTEFVVARSVVGLRSPTESPRDHMLTLSSGDIVTAGTIVIAAGVTYRRLGVPAVDELVGGGVFYGAAVSEARSMGGLDVCVLGGGNSAGQAAAHLAAAGARVTLVVRSSALAATMSAYLRSEIEAAANIAVRVSSEVVDAGSGQRLDHLVIRDNANGSTQVVPADALFIFIGARPHTEWLQGALAIDEHGFLLTGQDLMECEPSRWPLDRQPAWLETSTPGVFAAGDIRHGSIKRVAAAVGEGATAATLVGRHLAP